jgi:hypothetical protein
MTDPTLDLPPVDPTDEPVAVASDGDTEASPEVTA